MGPERDPFHNFDSATRDHGGPRERQRKGECRRKSGSQCSTGGWRVGTGLRVVSSERQSFLTIGISNRQLSCVLVERLS